MNASSLYAAAQPGLPEAAPAVLFCMAVIYLGFILLILGSVWGVFVKAGEEGWTSIVPILSTIVMLRIAGKPGWWFFLLMVPFVNLVVAIVIEHEICKRFRKETGFLIGMLFLPFIFWPILALDDSRYRAFD